MSTTTNWFITAATLRSAFKEEQRADGSSFWSCQHVDAGTELLEFIQELHDDELPNDWRYETIVSILDAIIDSDKDANTDDLAIGIADNLTDIYNHDLIKWYADRTDRVWYVDNANEEGMINAEADTIARLTIGQNECIRSMADRIIQKLGLLDD
jgi:hypothetical protein